MNQISKVLCLVLLFVCSQQLYAAVCIQNNNTLHSLVGLDGNAGTIYASLSSSSNECSCNLARFKVVNIDTDKALSILMAAKLAGNEVRVDFLDGADCNSANKVFLEQ